MRQEIQERLEKIAFNHSKPYCYGCGVKAIKTKEGTRCPKCFSDDLMRYVRGVGCEWGTDWVIEHLLSDNLTSIKEEDFEERLMEMLEGWYDKVIIGGVEWDHGEAWKRLDPIAFEMAVSEYIDAENEETIISFDNGSTYYEIYEIENFIEEMEENNQKIKEFQHQELKLRKQQRKLQ